MTRMMMTLHRVARELAGRDRRVAGTLSAYYCKTVYNVVTDDWPVFPTTSLCASLASVVFGMAWQLGSQSQLLRHVRPSVASDRDFEHNYLIRPTHLPVFPEANRLGSNPCYCGIKLAVSHAVGALFCH